MSESVSSSRPLPAQNFPVGSGSSHGTASPIGDRQRPPADEPPTVISSEPPVPAPHVPESGERSFHGGLLPGDRLDHFELLEFVGGGGMGRVFRAHDARLDRMVALKVLAPGQAGDADALARFQNEAQSAARLDHENIARVFHVGKDRGLHYIVFEYIEGVNLRALVHENGPLSLADAIDYTIQVAEALAHSAGRDVVHRDIKPSNVLVTPSGRAKLIDMGLARLHKIDTVAADLTASGVTLGTFDYISPEQARDPRNADVRSDIYSLGCTFFFMLAGRPPFPEGTVLQKLLQHQGDEPPDVRQFRPDMPDGVVAILRRMLAKDPRNRYPAASELLEELTALARQLGFRPLNTSSRIWDLPPPPRLSPLMRHLPWLAPTAALLCVVAVLHLWSANDAPPPPLLGGPEVLVGELPDPAEFAPPTDSTAPEPPKRQSASPPPVHESLLETSSEPDEPAMPATVPEPPVDGQHAELANSGTVPTEPPKSPPMETTYGRLTPEPVSARLAVDREAGETVRLAGDANEDSRLAFEAQEPAPTKLPSTGQPGSTRQAGVLVVHDGAKSENGFTSLAAAVAAAETGNIIELQYDGPREHLPLRIANRRLTIRGGDGFQPVVVFRPNGNDPVKQPRSMLTVTSGELGLVNVAIEMDISRSVPAEQWSLIEAFGGAQVNVQHCSISIHNASDDQTAYHPDVAFVRARPATGADRVTDEISEAVQPPVAIELVDCAIRGQATVLRVEAYQAVDFDWENGLLATSEPLAAVSVGARTPAEADAVSLHLRHVTALVGGGLLAMTDRLPATRQLLASVVLSDSIVVGASGAPLLDQYSAQGDDARRRIRFQGNRNFYEGFDVFWRLHGAGNDRPPTLLGFDAWQAHWGSKDENLPSLNRVVWQRALDLTVPAHQVRVADIGLLSNAAANPARGAASNGRDAGCDPARLPEFPAP